MKYFRYIPVFLIIAFVIFFAGFGCERDKIVVTPLGENLCWIEEYTAFSEPLFPIDSSIVIDSVIWPGIWGDHKLSNVKELIPMKSVLYFGWERLSFLIEIFRDDTLLVNQYNGNLYKIGDTFRFNIGDTIIQDYGFIYISNDSLRIYDFRWPDSNGVTILNIPHDYILWWGYAMKTKGIFVRQGNKE